MKLYELSDDPKRKEFLDELFAFMQKKGTPVNRIPIMAKHVLDLYELYKLVVAKGGLVEVINKKLWREITKGLNLPSSITSAAFTLRTQYMKYLYPYENEKLHLSTQSELSAAIDGNKREGRRPVYGFDSYPSPNLNLNNNNSNPNNNSMKSSNDLMNHSHPHHQLPFNPALLGLFQGTNRFYHDNMHIPPPIPPPSASMSSHPAISNHHHHHHNNHLHNSGYPTFGNDSSADRILNTNRLINQEQHQINNNNNIESFKSNLENENSLTNNNANNRRNSLSAPSSSSSSSVSLSNTSSSHLKRPFEHLDLNLENQQTLNKQKSNINGYSNNESLAKKPAIDKNNENQQQQQPPQSLESSNTNSKMKIKILSKSKQFHRKFLVLF